MNDFTVGVRRSHGNGLAARIETFPVIADTHAEAKAAADMFLDSDSVLLFTEREKAPLSLAERKEKK